MPRITIAAAAFGALISILPIQCVGAQAASPPRVSISAGTLEGTRLRGANQFLGIPFAKAKRFEAPADFTGSYNESVRDATNFGPACSQVGNSPDQVYGEPGESCLNLNIWMPAGAKAGDDLPCLIFVYGGSWQFGEAEPYNGSALAATHGVVYGSIAYRTGPIGFLAFEEDVSLGKSTGNWGMLDMQSALRWMRREVRAFGGDPNRLTIHGQSSGGQAVELHYVMPGSGNLLQGIISESGGLYANSLKQSLLATEAAANSTGCLVGGKPSKSCMVKLPVKALTSLTYILGAGPTVDGVTIPDEPMKLLVAGHVNNFSVIIGAQTNDTNRDMLPGYMNDQGRIIPMNKSDYITTVMDEVPATLLSSALALYPPAGTPSSADNVISLSRMSSDRMLCSARRRLSYISRWNGGARAWMYRFNWWYQSNSACTAEPNWHAGILGSTHEDEVTFVMGQPIFMFDGSCCGIYGDHSMSSPESCPPLARCTACYAPGRFGGEGTYLAYFDKREYAFSLLMGKLWTNFAASGNPNVRDTLLDAGHEVVWPMNEAGSLRRNIVLDPRAVPGGSISEETLYDDSRICELWDKADG